MDTDIIKTLFDNLLNLSEWEVNSDRLCAVNQDDLHITKIYIDIYDRLTPIHMSMHNKTNNNFVESRFSCIEYYSKVNAFGFITWLNKNYQDLLNSLTEIDLDQIINQWFNSDKAKGSGYYITSDGRIGDAYGPQNANRYMTKSEFYENIIKTHG